MRNPKPLPLAGGAPAKRVRGSLWRSTVDMEVGRGTPSAFGTSPCKGEGLLSAPRSIFASTVARRFSPVRVACGLWLLKHPPMRRDRSGLRRFRISRVYYGWYVLFGMVIALVVAEGVTFGSLSAYIEPLENRFGWSRAQVSMGFSVTVGHGWDLRSDHRSIGRQRGSAPVDADWRSGLHGRVHSAGLHDAAVAVVRVDRAVGDCAGTDRLHPGTGACGALVRQHVGPWRPASLAPRSGWASWSCCRWCR